MMKSKYFKKIDWILFFAILPLFLAGLVTMKNFGVDITDSDYFFNRQVIWIFVSLAIFFSFSFIDWRFLRKGGLLLSFFFVLVAVLTIMLFLGKTVRGASSWISFFSLGIEPSDPVKLVLILILAKYFSRRHIEIAQIKHIIISGVYAFIPTVLVFFQPDFGSALVIFLIWLGMIIVSGVSKKHLLVVFLIGAIVFSGSWLFVLKDYQKNRILTFLNPLKDIRGAGYNAFQSMVAVGSGKIFGKGIGFGTQSRLEFLPEHQTDFIFAAFVEEWGLIGVLFIFLFYGIIIWRILKNAFVGQSNFESLFGIGLAIFLASHFIVHVGMNIGLLPITGIGLPFISYGGSNLVTVLAGLGILMGMRRYSRQTHKDDAGTEFLGPK